MKIIKDFDLTAHNTFRMKVRCACYVEYDSAKELEALDWDALPKPIKHIGGGSNLLFTKDFPGTLLHSNIKYIKYVDMGFDDVPVMVGSGVEWDEFVAQTCSHGLWGAENLSLIPGEVGAAAVQNIGAYGVEVKDIISGVVCYDLKERCKVKFSVSECGYGYRESMFKSSGDRYIVTSVLVRLSRKPRPRLEYKGLSEALGDALTITPQTVREAVIKIRNEKLPDPAVLGSAGSFFKNPVCDAASFLELSRGYENVPHFLLGNGMIKVPAAWLIDQCDLKGYSIGGAQVYERQPLVIVNKSGEASPSDVMALCGHVRECVLSRFGITISPEVEFI